MPNIADSVRALAQPLADSLGLVLWDVRFFKEGTDWILLLTIDKDSSQESGDRMQVLAEPSSDDKEPASSLLTPQSCGVTLNDCEALSRAIDPLLDEADFIDHGYRLQVSSPGLERKLRTPEHLRAYLGEKVFIRLQRAFEGRREYHGTLADFDGSSFTLELPGGRGMTCAMKECAWVKADDF